MIGILRLPWAWFGGGAPTPPSSQLAAPSLVAELIAQTPATVTWQIRVSGPSSWPGGVVVAVQTRRGAAAFGTVSTTSSAVNIVATKEAAAYAIDVRGIAQNGGALANSEPSGVLSLPVSASMQAVSAGGIPLRFRVRVWPLDANTMSDGSSVPMALPFLSGGQNRIVVDQIEDPEEPRRITPTSVTWRAFSVDGVLLGSGVMAAGPTDWRAQLAPSAALRSVEITVTPADGLPTAIRFPVTFEAFNG